VLLQSAIYAGIPAANTAFKEAREVMGEVMAGIERAGKARPARKR